MTLKITALDIQRSRADWYAFHYENRTRLLAMSKEEIYSYQRVCELIPAPEMTIFGGVKDDYPNRAAYELAKQWNLDVNLVNPWYVSDEGWEQYQSLFSQLPEPLEMNGAKPTSKGTFLKLDLSLQNQVHHR